MANETQKKEFKLKATAFLSSYTIFALRSYGRNVGVAKPTEKNKNELIEEILSVLLGEMPAISISKKGAPVKNEAIDPTIEKGIGELFAELETGMFQKGEIEADSYSFIRDLKQFGKRPKEMLRVEDPDAASYNPELINPHIYRGQYQILNGIPMLLPLNGIDNGIRLVLTETLVQSNGLREGDVVSCYAYKGQSAYVVRQILTVNDLSLEYVKRFNFEELPVRHPSNRFRFYDIEKINSLTAKYLDWLVPVGKGQRGCIVSSPKAGKTELLQTIAKASLTINRDVKTLVLLLDQPPESIGDFQKLIDREDLLYATYDDLPNRQVFLAEYVLKRAKRLAEGGRDVLLLVDSFNALARAYNETDESLGGKTLACGLESKTVYFLKKYFGTARCFEKEGSITILGSLSVNTGNPADDALYTELATISNLEIHLSDVLAIKRLYPSIDLRKTCVKQNEALFTNEENEMDCYIKTQYLPNVEIENFYKILTKSNTKEEFFKKIKQV